MTSMRNAPPPRRVLVLGGGILGTSVAVHLQRRGAEVLLVTEAELASGASGRSLSWLNGHSTDDAYRSLRAAGIDRYRTLFAADPSRPWLRFDGGLWWTAPERSEAALARHDQEIDHGYDSHLLSRSDVGDHVTGVAAGPAEQLAVHNPGEGWVALPELIAELSSELVLGGAQLRTHAGRCSIELAGGRARGVRTPQGALLSADAVVVACGAQTPQVLEPLGVQIPDRSPLSMLVVTEPVATDVQVVLNTPRVAMRPHPGSAFALDHSWYEEHLVEHEDGSCSIDETHVGKLLDEGSLLLQDGPPLRAASWTAGRKPVPGDGLPVLGELDAVPGCHVVFTHSGATLGLIVGELTAHEVLTGAKHPLLAAFRPERFGTSAPSAQHGVRAQLPQPDVRPSIRA